jgi:hypothetical protein
MEPVTLNPLDCNLDFLLSDNNIVGSTFSDHGFAYMWSGARATAGITGEACCSPCTKQMLPERQHIIHITSLDSQQQLSYTPRCTATIWHVRTSCQPISQTNHASG